MKKTLRNFSLVLLTTLSLGVGAQASQEKYEASYEIEDYFDALINAGLGRALEMVQEQAREVLVSTVTDPKKREELLYRVGSAGVKKLEDIINDGGKSDAQKAEDITDMVTDTLLEPDSGKSGSLNVSLRYSTNFLATEITWDRKIQNLSCDEFKVEMDCKIDSHGFEQCDYDGYYERVEYSVVPEYRIFRVVDGQRTLATTIKGKRYRGSVEWSTQPKEWAKKIYEMLTGSGNKYADEGRMAHLDYDGDVREPNTTLSYLIEADPDPVWKNYSLCESSSSYSASAVFDGNADGYADFIPKSAYATDTSYMVPIINFILQ